MKTNKDNFWGLTDEQIKIIEAKKCKCSQPKAVKDLFENCYFCMNCLNAIIDPVYDIIARKQNGIDCTETESSEIKGFLREAKLPFEQVVHDIIKLFPLEYSEFCQEIENAAKAEQK